MATQLNNPLRQPALRTMEVIEDLLVADVEHASNREDVRERKIYDVDVRTCRISFTIGDATYHRAAVWEYSKQEKEDFKTAGHKYGGWLFCNVDGFRIVIAYLAPHKSGVVMDRIPYSHKRVRESFYRSRPRQRLFTMQGK